MPLISCKIELKLKQTKYCVLSEVGSGNTIANPYNIVFTIKDTKLYVLVLTLSARDNKKVSIPIGKGSER